MIDQRSRSPTGTSPPGIVVREGLYAADRC